MGLVHVPNIKGETLFLSLKDILMRLNLPLELCRGQAYDGAANMQGELKYLATRFAKENPSALHVHCLAHCLNLCVQDVARQCSSVRYALDLVQEFLQLFKLSPKRDALFKTNRDNRQPGSGNLRPLCPTRWTVKGASIESILKNYVVLLETMEEINTTNTEYSRRAGGQMSKMEKLSTFFGL